MPKQLVAVAPSQAALLPYDEVPVKADQIKVKLEYAAPKHGSELADFRGESPHFADYYDMSWRAFLPRDEQRMKGVVKFGEWNLGNQWVGRVIEVGSEVEAFQIGDRVCGYGGVRETQTVKAVEAKDLFKVPADMSWKNALCYDPAHFALCGVRDAHIRPGDRVAVFGLGAIGQIAVQIAKLAGATYVAAVDPIAKRRDVALEYGADVAFDPISTDVGLELKKQTNKLGVDVVIETSANEIALQQALRGIAYGGTIAYVGWARPFKGLMDWGREAHFNNVKIIFSRAYSEPNPDHPRWSFARIKETCWQLLSSGMIKCDKIIDPVVPFEQCAEAYEQYVDKHPEKSIKLGILFE